MQPKRLIFTATALGLGWLVSATAGCEVRARVLAPASEAPCAVTVASEDVSRADALVGDGTPGSCTEAAFNAALAIGGVVRFACGASPLTLVVTAEKVIRRDTLLDGGGTITLDGGGASRLFVLGAPGGEAVSLTLQYLTLRGGHATVTPASAGGSARAGGGAVLQFGGSLVVTDSVLEGNRAIANGPAQAGGAISAYGGRLVIARTRFERNQAGSGGAVAAFATELTLVRSQMIGNQAVGEGSGAEGIGGALLVSQEGQPAALCQVTMAGNQATYFGTAMHLQGGGGETMVIEEAAILDNVAPPSTSSAGSGPAVFLGLLAARLRAVTIAGNQGELNPGLWVNGGTREDQTASVSLTNVTIAGNRVHRHADATTDGVGAALWIEGRVRGEIVNCTLAGNLGEFGSGIVHPRQLTIRNTIIANQGTNPGAPQNCAEIGGVTVPGSGDRVLQWPAETLADYLCATGATLADPLLGPLQDHGGFAPTMMPAAGSPAVGAGADCPATDQRGHARPERCTLGAVEADGAAVAGQ